MPGSMNGPMLGPMLRPQSPVLGKCYVASEILYKIGDIWLEILKIKKSGISDLRDSKFQFGEGVTFLYKLFTKSVISGSKCSKSKKIIICSCLLMLAHACSCSACASWCSACACMPSLCSVPQNPILGGCDFPS